MEEKEKKQEKEREDEHKERTSVRGGRADDGGDGEYRDS